MLITKDFGILLLESLLDCEDVMLAQIILLRDTLHILKPKVKSETRPHRNTLYKGSRLRVPYSLLRHRVILDGIASVHQRELRFKLKVINLDLDSYLIASVGVALGVSEDLIAHKERRAVSVYTRLKVNHLSTVIVEELLASRPIEVIHTVSLLNIGRDINLTHLVKGFNHCSYLPFHKFLLVLTARLSS